MRRCHQCGLEVKDEIYICPDCGAEIVGSTGGLSLKVDETVKKKSSASLGTTIGSGSGYTAILKNDEEDDQYAGDISTPVFYDASDLEITKKKHKKIPVFSILLKLIFIGIIAFGLYSVFAKIFFGKEGPKSYEQAIDIYIEAINESDVDKMMKVTAPFYNDRKLEAEDEIKEMEGIHIDSYKIEDVKYMDSNKISRIQDAIKYQSNKTANIHNAVELKLRVDGKLGHLCVSGAKNGVITVQVINVKNGWYVVLDKYDDIDFE